MTMDSAPGYKCICCKKEVPDYRPEYCCSGVDCACKGQPIDHAGMINEAK